MRIVHVTYSLDPASGGVATAVLGICAALARQGHQVHLLSHGIHGRQNIIDQFVATVPHTDKVHLHYVPLPSLIKQLRGRYARQLLSRLIDGADVVHLHGVWEPILFHAATLAYRQGALFGFSPHGMLTAWALSQRRLKKTLALKLGYRRILERSRFLHMTSHEEKNTSTSLGLRPPMHVIPLGIFTDVLQTAPSPGTFAQLYPPLQGRRYVLYMGRLHRIKGLDHLIGGFALAAPTAPDLDLVIAGPDAGYRASLEQQIRDLGVEQRVFLTGPLYDQAKWAALHDAWCFCLPSDHEACSMAIIEALAFGLPVILSPSCNRPEVQDYQAGLIVPQEAHAIAQAILQLTNPDLRHRMSQAACRLTLELFDWNQLAKRFETMYRSGQPPPHELS